MNFLVFGRRVGGDVTLCWKRGRKIIYVTVFFQWNSHKGFPKVSVSKFHKAFPKGLSQNLTHNPISYHGLYRNLI